MPRGIAKRLIAFTLAVLTIATSIYIPDIVYADKTGGVGSEGVSGGGSSSGSFSQNRAGYRMYFIDKNGERKSNIVDIYMTDPEIKLGPKANAETTYNKWTYNTRFEDSARYWREADHIFRSYDSIVGANKPLGGPIIHNGDEYVPQGEEFREWMMAGAEMVVGTGGGGGNINYNYDYTGGGTSTGGTGGGTENKDNITLGDVEDALYNLARTAMNGFISNKENYLRATAIALVLESVLQKAFEFAQLLPDEREEISSIVKEIQVYLNEITPKDGWKDPEYEEIENNPNLLGLFRSLFDIAYADSVEDATQKDNGQGNITALLNYNDLFIFRNGAETKYWTDDEGNQRTDGVATMLANELYLIVEPIYWFVPAQQKQNADGEWVIGDACSCWFYGTPVSYGQWYQECKAAGKWTDKGYGGWYKNALNKTGAQALNIPAPLMGNNGVLVAEFNVGILGARSNDHLATMAKDDGYAIHYYYGIQGELPKIPTYDKNQYKTPHPAQDPDTIELTSGEKKEPGTSTLEIEAGTVPEDDIVKGHKNHSRTVTIVKTYSKEILCEMGDPGMVGVNENGPYKYEHVGTYVTYDTPGTISIQHEDDYRVREWKTTNESIYSIYRITPWYGSIPLLYKTWLEIDELIDVLGIKSRMEEYTWAQVEEANAGDEIKEIKMGLAADPDYDPDNPEAGDPELGYYEKTLFVHLVSRPDLPKTHTYDNPISPGPAPDPNDPDEGGPLTELEQEQCIYNIVKVYEMYTHYSDGSTSLDISGPYFRKNTAGLIKIEDESSVNNYKVSEWFVSDELWETSDIRPGYDYTTSLWDEIKETMPSIMSGEGPSGDNYIDIRDTRDLTKPRTLYVYLVASKNVEKVESKLDIEQSQLSKAIHTNANAYAEPPIGSGEGERYTWGNYLWKLKIDQFNKYTSFTIWRDHSPHSCGVTDRYGNTCTYTCHGCPSSGCYWETKVETTIIYVCTGCGSEYGSGCNRRSRHPQPRR